jgi:1,4-dihydroxy-2-naphthoate octaprenyltransferase
MVDALIIIGCLTFIFGIFYYVGETMFDELENNEEDGTE